MVYGLSGREKAESGGGWCVLGVDQGIYLWVFPRDPSWVHCFL